jgi:hypothetical protein
MHARSTLISSKYYVRIEHTAQSSTAALFVSMPKTNNILTPWVDWSLSTEIELRAF